jgi:hypothetical protein
MTLLPSETYRQGLPTLAFDKGVKVPSLWFKHPDNIDDKPPTHDPDRPYPCSRKVPLPYLTVIKWNPASTLLANEKMRYLLTAITPRGALLRSGAGSLGDLISGPIPRHHPGYDSSIRVRPFNLEEAMAEFDKMGFTKAAGSVYRTSPKGHELHLRLLAPAEGVHWIEGVLIDAYRAAGVRLTILRSTKGEASHDGQITGLFLDWPGLNFLPDFHSKTTSSIGFVSHRSKAFDTILAEYAVSLTTSKPNWALLKAIHGYLFELEPFTMLLHHFACLIPSSSIEGKVPKSINTLDPDWFRTMIMNSR